MCVKFYAVIYIVDRNGYVPFDTVQCEIRTAMDAGVDHSILHAWGRSQNKALFD